MFCFRKKSRGTSTSASIRAGLWGSYVKEMDRVGVVIANGSGSIRAGFSGETGPRAIFPAIVGRPKFPGIMVGSEQKDYFVGQQAQEKRGILTLENPIEFGLVQDWDDMEKIWDHTFTNELRVVSKEHPVLLTDVPLNPKANREKMTMVMFETFNVPKLRIIVDAELALVATGKPTGVVVESGDTISHLVPVIEGRYQQFATLRMHFAGRDLTDYLTKILSELGLHFTTSTEREIVKNIKETLCYVAADFEEELKAAMMSDAKDAKYEMPDGTSITIGSQRFRCPELLFKPSLTGKEFGGIHQQTFDAVMKCDTKPVRDPKMDQQVYDAIPVCGENTNTKKDLLANVVLAGGSTMFSGLPERLLTELQKLAPVDMKPHVVATENRKDLKWIGGSMWASAAQPKWMTKEEYDEMGPGIVHKYF